MLAAIAAFTARPSSRDAAGVWQSNRVDLGRKVERDGGGGGSGGGAAAGGIGHWYAAKEKAASAGEEGARKRKRKRIPPPAGGIKPPSPSAAAHAAAQLGKRTLSKGRKGTGDGGQNPGDPASRKSGKGAPPKGVAPQKACPQCHVKCACKRYQCVECGESARARPTLSAQHARLDY